MEDGLPGNNVTAVLQTRDGYIWVGTRSGLARFDGVRFKNFDSSNTPELQSPHVTCLFEASDGTLWIGHETGEVTCYKHGQFHPVRMQANWRGGKILGIGADKTGDIWLLNDVGELARLKDGFVIPVPAGATVHLITLARPAEGGLWIQRDSEVSLLTEGKLHAAHFDLPSSNRYVQGIGCNRDGCLWIMAESRILKWNGDTTPVDFGPAPWEWAPVHTVIEAEAGHLVAATTDHGLYLVFPGKGFLQFGLTNRFPTDWITSVCEDHEGNIWAGTGNGGLVMLREVNVTTVSPPDNWRGRTLRCVAAGPDGAVWIGTEGAGLYRLLDGMWTNYDEQAGLGHRYVWTLAFDAEARVWVGTWGGGIFVQSAGRFEQAPGLDELRQLSIPVAALFVCQDGAVVAGTGHGLLRYAGGSASWLARKPAVSMPDVRAVKEAPDGTIWFGMSGGGLGCFKDGALRQFRKKDGLPSDFVQCLHFENGGIVWIGTSAGLARLKQGRFSTITKSHGLPDDAICHIEEDQRGFYWISTRRGLAIVSSTELNLVADEKAQSIHCLTYGLSDGLPTLQFSDGFQPAGCKTADGYLWFPTVRGLVKVNPNNVRTNLVPPPVTVEEVRVDGRIVTNWLEAGARLRIAPGWRRLDVEYTGLSFVAPERVRFKYKLEGLDKEWIEVGTKRSVSFNYLPPGNYVFRVIACNNDGVWNERGAGVSLLVLPFFWQTGWFRVMAGILVLAGVGGGVWFETRRRMHRRVEQAERQHAIERERARIAKDIHDDLGASLTRITLLSQSALGKLGPTGQAGSELEQIYHTAHEVTRAMDEIVWAVNPQHDTLDSLANYLGKFAQDLLAATGIRCRLDIPIHLPNRPLTAEVRHNLFLAFKEALNNIVKHAAATEVRIQLKEHHDGFVLIVEDNGRGFNGSHDHKVAPPQAPARPASGNGLTNMARRMAEIGGRFEISSALGRGTRVAFFVPCKAGDA